MRAHGNNTGFSVIELLVGMVIGLICVLVIGQVYAISEGRKRSNVAGNDSAISGGLGLYLLSREAQVAGYGLLNPLTGDLFCTKIKTYDKKAATKTGEMAFVPVLIQDGGDGSDEITLMYSTNQRSSLPLEITQVMPSPAGNFKVTSIAGLKEGDVILAATPYHDLNGEDPTGWPCGRFVVTGLNSSDGHIVHNSGKSDWNPDGGDNSAILPGGQPLTIDPRSYILSVGELARRKFSILCDNLAAEDLNMPGEASCSSPTELTKAESLANDVVFMQAKYGVRGAGEADAKIEAWVDASGEWGGSDLTEAQIKRIVAVRIGLVVRTSIREKEEVSPAELTLWPASNVVPTTSEAVYTVPDRHYRYKTYFTDVPLRNVIWSRRPS